VEILLVAMHDLMCVAHMC